MPVVDGRKTTDPEANNNCLDGMKCPNVPACGSLGPFRIVATATFLVTDEGTDEFTGAEWDDDDLCSCVMCGDTGTVVDFKEADTQDTDPLLVAVDALIEWDAASPEYNTEALDSLPRLIEDIKRARQERGA